MPEPPPEVVEAVFQEVLDLDPDRQAAFLDERCGGDADLRAAVEELLHFDAEAHSRPDFLLGPRADFRAGLPAAEPEFIGRYRIVRWLGEGGMGTVYEAEQDDPRRAVALKVMRTGMDSPDLRKRFARESHILGRLHHVGIAQVYDAGGTADGRLYFAMEFIRGLPLDEHVRGHAPDPRGRLELMARVCDAVQHAHAHGVVHRDLKPANVLVDETGQPKVLDFGVAHATAGLLDSTAHTRTGQLVGTFGYMSPEQVSGDTHAVDARTDVYALGVILYGLLADRLPYRLDHLPIPEAVRVIREVEPSRLGSVARQFRGEVETIAAKALEKDPGRRYPSAGEFGADIRRHLAGEPIRARPTSALYKARKFVARNRGLVTAATVVFAALATATVLSLFAADDARRSAGQAKASAEQARAQAYQARIAAAVSALTGHDVADAARHLERAPEELRGWEWHHLHSRLDDSSAAPLPLRPGAPVFLLEGPEGLRVGTFTDAGLRVTDERGQANSELPFPIVKGPFAVARTPAGGFAVATPESSGVVLRDETGQVLKTVRPQRGGIVALALSPDRKRVAVAALFSRGHASIVIHDAASGKEVARFAGHDGFVHSMAYSPDGRRLASGGDDSMVRIWDTVTRRPVMECKGHTSKVLSVSFRPDGHRLLTAAHDHTVRQWDVETGHPVGPIYDRHGAEVSVAVYVPDGQRVASAGADRTVRLWWANDGRDQAVFRGHAGGVARLAFSPDGRRVLSASYDRPDSPGDATVRLWESAPEVTLPVLAGHTSFVYPVAFSPDGRWIASGAWDHDVRLWDAATGEECAKLPHTEIVRVLAFSPDGTRLLCGGDFDKGLLIWDVATGTQCGRVTGLPMRSVRSLAVSPDGTRVAVGTVDTAARFVTSVWDLATNQSVGTGEGAPLAFSPDGKWLVGRDVSEKNVVLRDAQDGHPVAQYPGHTAAINAIAFHPDGRQFLSASSDRTVRLWDIAAGRCVRTFEGHTGEVFGVAFHPDGTRFASGGRDRAVWLWNPESEREVARLPGHTSYVWSLAFSPDGRTLASGSGDSTVRLWDTDPLRVRYAARRAAEELRPEADRLVGRLFREKKDASAVAACVRADESLNEAQRTAALRAVLRRSAPGAEAKPAGK